MPASLLRQVKASAGSGKTYDLTRRFLEHLARVRQEPFAPACALTGSGNTASGGGWGDILAVTFTNSAAAEMKDRVVRRLKETALGLEKNAPLEAARAAQWVDIILRQYGALNIRTIDSLLHLVVRTAALDLGLPPDFEPAFTTDETLAPILDACLERAWSGEASMLALLHEVCRSLLFHADAKGFMVGERITRALRPLLDAAFTGGWPDLSPPEAVEARLAHMAGNCVTLARALLRRVDEEGLRLDKRARTAFEALAASDFSTVESAYLRKENLDGCLLTASRGTASAETIRVYDALTQATADYNGPGHLLRRGLRLLPFAALAREVAAGLEDFQQAEGKIPAVLVPLLAQEVLELQHGVPAALCRLGSGLNHILIDEFQDTSRPQWEALRPLAEEALSRGGSLTVVGDIKQAIYGWRGGDATLFDGVVADSGLRAMAPSPDLSSLDTNWRSRETIVRCNNAVFRGLGDAQTAHAVLESLVSKECPKEILLDGAATLAKGFADAAQKWRTDGADGGHVTMTPVRGVNAEDLNDAVREALRKRLLDDIATRRPWADVTILVRSNDMASLAASWLMEWQVPVITENSLLLGEHPLVAESLAFLALLDSPQDDVAFWTVLAGTLLAPCRAMDPAVADPTALNDWAVTRRKGYLSMAFRDAFPEFWRRWLAPFHNRANLLSPYDTVQEWYRLLRVEDRFPQARTFVRRFLEVVHSAAERGHATLGAFLEHWRQSGGDEKVPMPASTDAVRIMTIHKSKGLQFPVVIIPWMHFNLRDDSPAVPIAVAGLRVLAPRCKEMGDIHYAAQVDAAREALNLFYVAWTRAEDEMHIFHTTTPGLLRQRTLAKALDVLLPAAGLELPCVLGAPFPACNAALPLHAQETALSMADPTRPDTPCEVPPPMPSSRPSDTPPAVPEDDWQPMHWMPRLKIFRNPLEEMEFTPRKRGILAHHCLEQLRLTGDVEDDARRAVTQGMRTFPLPVPQPEAMADALTRSLVWYASLPEAALWMREGLPEQSLMDTEGRLHRVDLLIPPPSGSLLGQGWIAVDYKTGEADEAHVSQIRRYLALLDGMEESAELPPATGVLVYLDLQRCRVLTRDAASALLPAPLPLSDMTALARGGTA